MKKITKITKITFLLFILLAFVACEKDDDNDNNNDPQYDNSLIVVRANGDQMIMVNPVDGSDLFICTPDVRNITRIASGYMSRRDLVTSHSGPSTSIMTLYACDAKTGDNLVAITDENELDVQRVAGSPVADRVVLSADEVDTRLISFQIFTVNEDGSGLQQLSYWQEGITGIDGSDNELNNANFPSFSPNGSEIAFTASGRQLPISNNQFFDAIMIMDNGGGNKEVIFWVPKQSTSYEDVCWTQDGQFLLFTMFEDNVFHRKVKAVHIASKTLTDITSQLEIEGVEVENIWTSPNSDKIVFTQHLGGGSDLFVAEFEIDDDVISIKGIPLKITDKVASGHKYYEPFWQLWDEN